MLSLYAILSSAYVLSAAIAGCSPNMFVCCLHFKLQSTTMVGITVPVCSGDSVAFVNAITGKYLNVDGTNLRVCVNEDRQSTWIIEKSFTGAEQLGGKRDITIYYGDTVHFKSSFTQKYAAIHQNGTISTTRPKAPGPSESFALIDPMTLHLDSPTSPSSPEPEPVTHLSLVSIQTIYGSNIAAEKDGKASSHMIGEEKGDVLPNSDRFTVVIAGKLSEVKSGSWW
jgi:hypothetical protein